ncbi:MAG: DNA primase [Myxococcales bacterium]|nr:DNA primase [Myxococcales bacterium]
MAKPIPEPIVDEVLNRTDIQAVVGQYVKLKPKGGRLFGLCPFHQEKSPSFSVSPSNGLFYCFGCGAGGSALQFLQRVEGWTFRETLEELAKRAGVPLPTSEGDSKEWAKRRSEREEYHEICELACTFFEQQLTTPEGSTARQYLIDRTVSGTAARAFRIGYAPDGWEGLVSFLRRNKVSPADVEKAGLALKSRRGTGYFDRFRHRVMFPVLDQKGRVVAFSGRALDNSDNQKYTNSPELPFFKKGDHLFGLGPAKEYLRRSREAVVVEGNFDVVTLSAAGVGNVVAPLGTALTENQVRLLKRVADSATLLFDGDEAGRRAMRRCMANCFAVGLPVRAALLPMGEDPDSFVRSHGVGALEKLLESARPLAEVVIDEVVSPAVGTGTESRVRAAKQAMESLQVVSDEATKRGYAQEISRRLELPLRSLSEIARGARTGREERSREPAAPNKQNRISWREAFVVQLIYDEPLLAERFQAEPELREILTERLFGFVDEVAEKAVEGESFNMERVIAELPSEDRGPILEALASECSYDRSPEFGVERNILKLRKEFLHRATRKLADRMRAAERAGDEETVDALVQQHMDRQAQLAKLERR